MAGKGIKKVMGFLGIEDEYDEFEEMEEEEKMEEKTTKNIKKSFEYDDDFESFNMNNSKKNKVVNIHTATSAKVIIIKPSDFDEATTICDNLKNRKIVVVNTTLLEQKIGQRLLDFVGGASYALGASIQDIEKGVYILTPSNVEVDSALKDELSSKGIFSFIK